MAQIISRIVLKNFKLRNQQRQPLSLMVRLFSQQPQQPPNEEAPKFEEKDFFNEEKMKETRQSIKEKLKMIQQQELEKDPNEKEHDPKEFEFTRFHRHQNTKQSVYYYSKTLKFLPNKDGTPIFSMNTDIYKTANIVDAMVFSLAVYSTFKVSKQIYILTTLGFSAFSVTSAVFWSVMLVAQAQYLMSTYLRQVFLVQEIELLKNLEEIRIKTILQSKFNVFNRFSTINNEFTVKIADVSFSDKDKPNSPIIRILVGNKKFYLHKNASKVQDFELLKAVFSPNIQRIQCLK